MLLTPRPALSGTQTFLRHGRYSAAIASVGASLRSLRFDDRDLIIPFTPDEVRPAYHDAVLAPWPNRVIDGHYSFQGTTHQLSITEPARGHALHGLLVWQDWSVESCTTSAVVLSSRLVAQQGYPFALLMQVRYELDDDGLTTTITALNTGPNAAPMGLPHTPIWWQGKALWMTGPWNYRHIKCSG